MFNLENHIADISEIEKIALKICKAISVGDIIMLQGELGVGKTTLSRSIINNLHLLNGSQRPDSINSPTYPILLTYDLTIYQIYHYDFYRVKTIQELDDLDFFENTKNNVTLIEWPELLIDSSFNSKYYLINIDFQKENKRIINIKYT